MSTKDKGLTISPNGQQTDCYTTLAFLEQMLKEEQEKERRGYYNGVTRDFTTRDALYTIIMLIKERQANGV